MKTPVIIPAYNAEVTIAKTLEGLPRELVYPIVSVNGSNDRTSAISEFYGAKVISSPELGKLPAVQRALRELGTLALEPLIVLDADSIPVFPIRWHNRLLGAMQPNTNRQSVVSGPVWFTPKESSNYAVAATRSLFRMSEAALSSKKAKVSGKGGAQHGPNLGLKIQRKDLLDEVLALEHFWPGDDHAITETLINDNGGEFKQLLCLDALVLTPESESYPPLRNYLKFGIRQTNDALYAEYIRRGAPGSKPYEHSED